MAQYIDKSVLVAEIERQISAIDNYPKHTDILNIQIAVLEGNKVVLTKLLSFIDTLEVKDIEDLQGLEEVDLEKEIDNIWNPRFNLGWDEKSLLSMNHEGFITIVKHFFELGLKTQKGE